MVCRWTRLLLGKRAHESRLAGLADAKTQAASVALEQAKETIYIEDWWLSPELFMRRTPHGNQEWRLDQILKRRAEAGVKIYVIVYREVEVGLR